VCAFAPARSYTVTTYITRGPGWALVTTIVKALLTAERAVNCIFIVRYYGRKQFLVVVGCISIFFFFFCYFFHPYNRLLMFHLCAGGARLFRVDLRARSTVVIL
jgi:hypothetical protein